MKKQPVSLQLLSCFVFCFFFICCLYVLFFSSALVLDSPRLSPFYNKLERFGWRIVKQELPVRFDEIAEGNIQQRQKNKKTHTHTLNITLYYSLSTCWMFLFL